MFLNTLSNNNSRSKVKRVGRGTGSGVGKTSTRGHNGQKSRSGSSIKGFEGGQMPIHRRLPKRGFNVYSPNKLSSINIDQIQKAIDQGKIDPKNEISEKSLIETGIVKKINKGIKLISRGEIKNKINIKVFRASSAAIKSIEKVGGKIELKETKNNNINNDD